METNSKTDIKMSVMFITYNRKNELLRALKSCVKNSMPDMEIVIVDNHSEDHSKELAENYLINYDIPFKYYYSAENMGISEGRNIAFNMCSGEFVFCLDDDALIDSENFFRIVYEKMKKEPEAVAAAVEIYEPVHERYLKGYIYEKFGKKYALSYIGAAHVIRRKFFEGRELYPSTLRFGSEEYYIAYRIRKNRKKLLYLDEVRVLHLPSQTARVSGRDRDMNIIINNYIIRKLCYPTITLPLLTCVFYMRAFFHGFFKNESYGTIRQLIDERYERKYIDRMPIREWFRMIFDTSITQIL